MMSRSSWCGRLGLILGALVWVAPVSGWAGPPKKVPDEAKLREAAELMSRVERLDEEGKYGEAAQLAERACAIMKDERGEASSEFSECIDALGWLYLLQGAHENAKPLLERALAIREKALGSAHPDVAQSLHNLAMMYYAEGAYGKAEPLHERALAIREKVLGPDHPDVALSLNNLAMLYQAQGAYAKAESLHKRALAIHEKVLGPDHPDVAESLNNLAEFFLAHGAYEKAEPLFERALAIREKALRLDHPYIAASLNNLAELYKVQGAFRRAEPLLGRALAIHEKALGPDHPHVAMSLGNLAVLYEAQGVYGKAEPLFERALAIAEDALGPDHPHVATSLNNLAMLYEAQGAYRRAEPLLERALAIREKALGPDHLDVATSLHNLAGLHWNQGAYGKAESLLKRALAIREKALGSDHPDVAMSLNNLALLYKQQKAYDKAEPIYERALTIRKKALGPDNPSVATSLHNLAALYWAQGAYSEAEPLYMRALAITEKVLGPDHPDVATNLSNLAKLYWAQGAYSKAEPLYMRALAIKEKAKGPDHPHVALNFKDLAEYYHDQGNHGSGLRMQRRALDIEETNLVRNLIVADESRRLAYASTLSGSLDYALSLHLRVVPEHDTIAELTLTTLLRRKSRVQDLVVQSNAALRRSLPADDRHLLDDLSDVDSRVAVLSSRGPGKLAMEAFRQQLDELRQERDRLWSELAKHSALVEALDHPVTIEDVQQTFPNGSALIELARYAPRHDDAGVRVRKHEAKPPSRYAAYLIFPDRFDWVDLGPAAPIDEHVKAFRKALQTKQAIPTDLYDAVMRPIVEKLGSTHRLVIAPAGALSLIPFGALHNGKRYLVEEYELRYVTTGRDLLDPPASPAVTGTPVTIVANPTGAFLPDAEIEADFLEGFFPDTRVLRGKQATETNVRTVERPLILHMATHGFFGEARNERDNPMFRSGLHLADIEQVQVDREHDDGQLTAYEVSGMDLRGTQLVVLSACDTGMGAEVMAEGKVLMSEGVSGLRRAFAMAGARTTVMSLWAVSGVTAQRTMEAYYRKLAEGQGPGEAMQAVQLEMLRTKEYAHPKDWAVFIVSGDDDPLEFPAGQAPRVEEPGQPGPPPVRRRAGCTLAAPSSDRDLPVPAFLLSVLGLIALRRRRE
jgi:MYXO-CTERM domain-containing protein